MPASMVACGLGFRVCLGLEAYKSMYSGLDNRPIMRSNSYCLSKAKPTAFCVFALEVHSQSGQQHWQVLLDALQALS